MKRRTKWCATIALSLLAVGCSSSIENPKTKSLERSVHPYAPLNSMIPIDTQIRHTKAIAAFKSGDIRRTSNRPFQIANLHMATNEMGVNSTKEAQLADGRIGVSLLNQHGQKVAIGQQGDELYFPTSQRNHYRVHYRNYTANVIFEIVPVDGMIDARSLAPKRFEKKGYLLFPGQTITLEGNYPMGVTGNGFFVLKDPTLRYQISPERGFSNEEGYSPAPRY